MTRCLLALGLITALAAAAGAQLSQRAEPDVLFSVEVSRVSDDGAAAERVATLEAEGYAPISFVRTGGECSVRVGEFVVMADAQLLCDDLMIEHPAARILETPFLGDASAPWPWGLQPMEAPVGAHDIFHLDERPLPQDEPLRFVNEQAAIADGGQLLDESSPEETAEIEEEALQLADMAKDETDPARGLAYFVIADVRAGRGDLQPALDLAMQVATRSLAASPQKRYEAMWLVARLHHAMGERLTAYRAYRELEPFITDPRDMARCLVEQAGLVVELRTNNGYGRRHDGRLKCQEMLDRFGTSTDVEVQHRCATAASMFAQSYWMDDPGRCIALMHENIRLYSEFSRETSVAHIFIGRCSLQLGRLSEAREAYAQVIAMHQQGSEDFPNLRHDQEAASALLRICTQMGDASAAEHWVQYLEEISDPRSQASLRWGQQRDFGTPPR